MNAPCYPVGRCTARPDNKKDLVSQYARNGVGLSQVLGPLDYRLDRGESRQAFSRPLLVRTSKDSDRGAGWSSIGPPGSATVVAGFHSYRLLIRSSQLAQDAIQPCQLGVSQSQAIVHR
jgi:hypothetical protein